MTEQGQLFEEGKSKRKSRIEDPLFDVTANRHGGNEESAAALRRISASKASSRHKVYDYVLACGESGATTDQVAEHFQTTPNAISGRMTELKALKLLTKTDRCRLTRSGCNARVFVAIEKVRP